MRTRFSREAFARLLVTATFALVTGAACADTLALGDSIALGTGQALNAETIAVKGMGSCAIDRMVPAKHFDRAVISAGVNDAPGMCVDSILSRVSADEVIVILPPGINSARAHIIQVAKSHHFKTVSYVPGKDGLHPRSYAEVASQVNASW